MRIKQHQPTEGVDYLTDINNSKRLLARTISNEVVSDKGQDLLAVNYNLITNNLGYQKFSNMRTMY